MGYVFILLTVICTVYSQLIMKQEINAVPPFPSGPRAVPFLARFLLRPLVVSGFAGGGLAALFWIAALTRFELSYAYPFMSLSFLLVGILSFLFFDESLTVHKLIGLALIVIGVWVVSISG